MADVDQLVAEDRRAWHAGKSIWKGDSRSSIPARSVSKLPMPAIPVDLPDYPLRTDRCGRSNCVETVAIGGQ
jgi:hypothetical protein